MNMEFGVLQGLFVCVCVGWNTFEGCCCCRRK